MKKYMLIFLISLNSCSNNKINNQLDYKFIVDNDITFEEFKLKLDEYTKISGYPNIND